MSLTKISDFFIDNYFECSNPSYILVYIMLLRLCKSGECNISRVADGMGVMENDIRRALKHWEKAEAIKFSEDADGLLKIEFLLEKTEDSAPANIMPAAIATSRPVYTSKEIDYYLESNMALRTLFKSCENHMGKLLSYNDMCVLFGFHDWLRFPFDLIELLVEYCCSNGHTSIRYIEKVAVTWADAGINNAATAKERIKLYNKDFRQIMAALGKSDREPVKSESDFMVKWLKTYKMPMDVVLEACERTVLQISRPTFKYADGIIERWHADGIVTAEGIEKADAEYKGAFSAKTEKRETKPKTRKTKFSNFRERDSVNFSEIERLEMERIDKELGL